MLHAQLILFPILLRCRRRYIYTIAPLVMIFFSTYAKQLRNTIVVLQQEWYIFFYPALPRAIALMSGGTICYAVSQALRLRYGDRLTDTGRRAFAALELLFLWLTLHEVATRIGGKEDIYQYTLILILVTLLMSDLGSLSRFFTHPVFGWLGRISLDIYLAQGLALGFFPESMVQKGTAGLIAYLFLAIALGVAVWAAAIPCAALMRALQRRISAFFVIKEA